MVNVGVVNVGVVNVGVVNVGVVFVPQTHSEKLAAMI